MDGPPTVLMANKVVINRLVAAARATNAYTENVLSFAYGGGTAGTVRQYGNLVLLDPGSKAGANTDIIPVTNKTVGTNTKNFSDVYAVRFGLDGFHGVSVANQQLIKTYMPALDLPGAVKTGEVEMGPVSVALKATRAAAGHPQRVRFLVGAALMAKTKITAPVAQPGEVTGVGGLVFTDGVAETDNDAIIAYCEAQGTASAAASRAGRPGHRRDHRSPRSTPAPCTRAARRSLALPHGTPRSTRTRTTTSYR
jgi:hypothetical protein